MFDLIIIGAGCAGLAAAQQAKRYGLNTLVLEAKNRIGGRAYTNTETFGVPVDYGCHWLHAASINPLRQLADEHGFAYERADSRHQRLFIDQHWGSARELQDYQDYCDHCWQLTNEAGQRGHDVAIADLIDTQHHFYPLFSGWCAALNGSEPELCSTLDHYRFHETGEDWPVIDGYGALVAQLGAGIDIKLNTPVQRIHWGGQNTKVDCKLGTLSAKAVIITVSNGVLNSHQIQFEPDLPLWKYEALDGVPMGQANKVIFQLTPAALADIPESSHVRVALSQQQSGPNIHFLLRQFGHNTAIAYIAGGFSKALEQEGKAAIIDFALEQLKTMLGHSIETALVKIDATAWNSDEYIRGAYSMAKPGEASQRRRLAEPLAERLFFAGESTSIDAYGAAHGAYSSGIAALQEVFNRHFADVQKSVAQSSR